MASNITRRAFVATAATTALAGCSLAGGDGPKADEYRITGTADSDLFTEAELLPPQILDFALTGGGADAQVRLQYDEPGGDLDYYTVYFLLDGDIIGESDFNATGEMELSLAAKGGLENKPTYRAITRTPVEVIDDFELAVEEADSA